jgi:hypothetical protein
MRVDEDLQALTAAMPCAGPIKALNLPPAMLKSAASKWGCNEFQSPS